MTQPDPQAEGTRATLPGSSSLSPDAAALFDLLVDCDDPIPQYEAGVEIGLDGGKDTVRRKVQHLRDEIYERTGVLVCSSWSPPFGMYLPESGDDEDEYIDGVVSRAISTLSRFRKLERERRLRIAGDLFDALDLGDEEIASDALVLPVAGKVCPQCGVEFDGRREDAIYCTDLCKYEAARERGSI